METGAFDKFIQFGAVGNKESRKDLAFDIFSRLEMPSDNYFKEVVPENQHYDSALLQILANPLLKELCATDAELAEKITLEILEFVNKTQKQLNKAESPYNVEKELREEFNNCKKSEFKQQWDKVNSTLSALYQKSELDIGFYAQEFIQSLNAKNKDSKDVVRFESVKEHFVDKWDVLLTQKQIQWELELIDEQRKKFCEELFKRLEEFKNLKEALEPFTRELGRLWDMSTGKWQHVNFDLLKRYADILKKDKSLMELAEMLGRMQQAEKEFEEEMFANIELKPEWKVDHASKSDLIGIHESDDLSSMLPSEMALLADPNLQSVFFKKFAEKKLQTYEYQAKMLSYREEEFQDSRQKAKEDAKGPFIICVDTSGSMHGTPESVAKTLCFAILKIAIRENRKCYLISFSTGIETLDLTDLKNSLDKLIAFLSMSFHGGTDASPAMKAAIKMLGVEDYKKADVIMVSDFVMPAFDSFVQKQMEVAKVNKTKFHSLVIGKSQNTAATNEFDNNWFYDENSSVSVLTLVRNIASL